MGAGGLSPPNPPHFNHWSHLALERWYSLTLTMSLSLFLPLDLVLYHVSQNVSQVLYCNLKRLEPMTVIFGARYPENYSFQYVHNFPYYTLVMPLHYQRREHQQPNGHVVTLRVKLSGAVYCNRSCLWVCLFVCLIVCLCVCGSVTTVTRNCVHRSSPNWVCR